MFEWLLSAVLGFVARYGYVAVFLYMILETAFILHFVPSEVVVPVAASQLVHDPISFVLFVADTTAGATVGSLLAYVGFGRYGERFLERYGHVLHISQRDVERSQEIFINYGESSVFWGRMLPLIRALISIPAGLAEMDLRRFLLYSAAGAALFNTALTYLVYSGAGTTSPLGLLYQSARAAALADLTYIQVHTEFVLVLVGLGLTVVAVTWLFRGWIRSNPTDAKLVFLHVVRLLGFLVGGLFLVGAVFSPGHAFDVITALWDDPRILLRLGFSAQLALLLTGAFIVIVGAAIYEVGQLVELAHLQRAVELARARLRGRS